MSARDKVLWEEGMFLAPQHFQLWDRHFEGALYERVRALEGFHWGLTDLVVNLDSLRAGQFELASCRALLSDGTSIRIPEDDAVPGARDIREAFEASATELDVLLALPRPRVGALVAKPEQRDHSTARYIRDVATIIDDTQGALEREVNTARKNLRVIFAGEPADDYVTLPIARLVREGASGFTLSPTYVAPCLHAAASGALTDVVHRVLETLSAKTKELTGQQGQRLGGTAQFSMAEATGFWLLYTVNSFLPAVMHLHANPRVHPMRVYEVLASLAGALATFRGGDAHPGDLPHYDHADLTTVFERLSTEIGALPQSVVTSRCIDVPLERIAPDTFHGRVRDTALFDNAQFLIATVSDMPADRVIREFPALAKVSSPQQINEIRNLAVRGVQLHHVPNPPRDIPQRTGCQYFELSKAGDHWMAIAEARTLGIYLPQELADLRLECVAVKGD